MYYYSPEGSCLLPLVVCLFRRYENPLCGRVNNGCNKLVWSPDCVEPLLAVFMLWLKERENPMPCMQ